MASKMLERRYFAEETGSGPGGAPFLWWRATGRNEVQAQENLNLNNPVCEETDALSVSLPCSYWDV
jgi:hypothetical protein